MNAVELENITKTFGDIRAVDDLSLMVPKGSVYGFIGPNGSGKTTTLRMIMNIFYPDNGSIHIFGQQLQGASTDRIGYMPEERGLYKNMKVKELLKFYGSLKNGKNLDSAIKFWLERFELSDWADKKIETLSKGMSQKVQFIATVIAQPDLVILDEPFSGLDPVNSDIIKDAVLEIQKRGTTVIFSTHDMNVAEKMCDYIFMIYQGKKVLDGTLSSIQNKYGTDTLRIRTDDGNSVLSDLHGIIKINDFGQMQELRLEPDCDTQKILSEIMARTRIWSFDIIKPSLHDIFVRIVKYDMKEVNHE
jgi:ABC-2 type transport system ATP-binding protein